MKKIFLLLACLILLTGCKAEYRVKIDNNSNNEKLDIYIPSNLNREQMVDDDLKLSYNEIFDSIRSKKLNVYHDQISEMEYGDEIYYKKENIDNKNEYGVRFSNSFPKKEYYRSSIVKECFKDINIIKEGNTYIYRTSNKCEAFDNYKLLDEVKIIVDVDKSKEILYSNADEEHNNTLTWIINRNNYQNKKVSFAIDKKINIKENEEKPPKKQKGSKKNKIIILSGIIIIAIAIFIVVKLKKNHM